MKITNDRLKELQESLQTSREIIMALAEYRKTEKGICRVWENPSKTEIKKILKNAFYGTSNDVLFWGEEKFSKSEVHKT